MTVVVQTFGKDTISALCCILKQNGELQLRVIGFLQLKGDRNACMAKLPVLMSLFVHADTPPVSAPYGHPNYEDDAEWQQRASALFLLKLKEGRRLSQVALDDVVAECRTLFQQTIERVKTRVTDKLTADGHDDIDIEGLETVFEEVVDPFAGLDTLYKQEKYFREKLGLIVSNRNCLTIKCQVLLYTVPP